MGHQQWWPLLQLWLLVVVEDVDVVVEALAPLAHSHHVCAPHAHSLLLCAPLVCSQLLCAPLARSQLPCAALVQHQLAEDVDVEDADAADGCRSLVWISH